MNQFGSTLFALLLAASLPLAASQKGAKGSVEETIQKIRKEIVTLPSYGVFDDIRFSMDGDTVILSGYASRPTLSDSAERVVRDIPGVENVENRIEVLPLSRMDDDIRARAYVAIYGDSFLSRYRPGGGPIMPSMTRRVAGITQDPPPGLHSIHIIVRNGNILLSGVVDNKTDRDRATIVANGVPGAFAVKNELVVSSGAGKKQRGK